MTVNLPSLHNSVHRSCLRLRLCSWSSVQEEIRAVLQSVETSLPFVLTIWGQFVLWVVSLGLSNLTMGKEGSTALGRERERRAAKKTVLMECLFRAESHTQRQLILRGALRHMRCKT